jgi:hypothetical protein
MPAAFDPASVVGGVAAGDQDDRWGIGLAGNQPHHLEAGDVGKLDVEQYHVG